MRALLVTSMTLMSGCCGMFGGPCGGPSSEVDTCGQPMPATAQAIEIGRRAEPFRAYRDDETADIEVGGQGLSMLGMRLRLVGAGDVECIAQLTTIEVPDGTDAFVGQFSSDPLRFLKQPDGSRVTKTILQPAGLPYGNDPFMLVAQAAGQTVRVRLHR